jgi:hypothetical protein
VPSTFSGRLAGNLHFANLNTNCAGPRASAKKPDEQRSFRVLEWLIAKVFCIGLMNRHSNARRRAFASQGARDGAEDG